jgi:hypothetical protein
MRLLFLNLVCFTGKSGDVLHLLRACEEVVLYEYIRGITLDYSNS